MATKRIFYILRILLVFAIFVAAIWLLHGQLKGFDTQEFLQDVRQITWGQISLALFLLGVNYVILFGYDFLALRYIGHRLPLRKLAMASFIGHASSFNFGSLFGGAAARYRLYSGWKLSAVEILQLIAILGVTFWLGVLALAGIVFLVDPFPIPAELGLNLSLDDVRPLAFVLLAIVAVYLILCALRRKPIKCWHWEIPLPPPRLTIAQIVVSCADLVVAAAVMYVLVPPDADVPFLRFLGVFLLAWVVAAFTHVPGATGVLEVIVIGFLCPEGGLLDKEQGAAILLVFRSIYYLLPLVIAGVLFIGHELAVGRELLRELRHPESGEPPRGEPQSTPPLATPPSLKRDEAAAEAPEPRGDGGCLGNGAPRDPSGTDARSVSKT